MGAAGCVRPPFLPCAGVETPRVASLRFRLATRPDLMKWRSCYCASFPAGAPPPEGKVLYLHRIGAPRLLKSLPRRIKSVPPRLTSIPRHFRRSPRRLKSTAGRLKRARRRLKSTARRSGNGREGSGSGVEGSGSGVEEAVHLVTSRLRGRAVSTALVDVTAVRRAARPRLHSGWGGPLTLCGAFLRAGHEG